MKVSEAMTSDVQLCTPQDTLKDAAEAMVGLSISACCPSPTAIAWSA